MGAALHRWRIHQHRTRTDPPRIESGDQSEVGEADPYLRSIFMKIIK